MAVTIILRNNSSIGAATMVATIVRIKAAKAAAARRLMTNDELLLVAGVSMLAPMRYVDEEIALTL
jgi:pilus assembly protein TadC